jgi:chromosome partitioning protein
MWVDAESRDSRRKAHAAHVIVLGNEKGGSGKSTTAMHLAIALLKAGQRVVTIDLDARQGTLTHYVERRRRWAKKFDLTLELPLHFCVARGEGAREDENEQGEFARFADAITEVEHRHDFIVIDTPGADSYLTRLAHSMADTLITPLNDSFLDFDVLANVDADTLQPTGTSHYAELVREARRQRRMVDGRVIDWVVVRNRLSMPGDRSGELVGDGLNDLAGRLGFRIIDGFAERAAYRELFPRGLTALDETDESTPGFQPFQARSTARAEMQNLLAGLMLPLNERGRKRAAARAEWFMSAGEPLDVDDVLADEADFAPLSSAERQTQ